MLAALKALTPEILRVPYRRMRHASWKRTVEKHRTVAARLHTITDGEIASGPFKGMRYISESACSMIGPKILGTYESEIANWIEELLTKDLRVLVDIGAAEGYYAVGFLYRNSKVKVLAYEIDPEARRLLKQLAELNGVAERLTIRDEFRPAELDIDLTAIDPELDLRHEKIKKVAIIVDIEGAEGALLNPDKTTALRTADLLIETHDCFNPGVGKQLRRYFSPTHEIEETFSKRRALPAFEADLDLSKKDIKTLMNEHRPRQSWLYCASVATK